MSDIILNKDEMKESKEVFEFLRTLSPEMQEKLKIIAWWESLKKSA